MAILSGNFSAMLRERSKYNVPYTWVFDKLIQVSVWFVVMPGGYWFGGQV